MSAVQGSAPLLLTPTKLDAVLSSLSQAGVPDFDARGAATRWEREYGHDAVLAALSTLSGRQIAKPISYLDKVLKNDQSQRVRDMPKEVRLANPGPVLPRPIRRRIQVGPKAEWEFEGWTPRGHRRGGSIPTERLAVWRTDAGTLNYRKPAPGQRVPDFDEDPGVFEQD